MYIRGEVVPITPREGPRVSFRLFRYCVVTIRGRETLDQLSLSVWFNFSRKGVYSTRMLNQLRAAGDWNVDNKNKSLISATPRAERPTQAASMFQTVILVYVVLFILGTSALDTAPTVDLGYVRYSGFQNATAGINYYRGIPYAVPPLGNLRWREPRPIELNNPFNGQVINASQYGPACY